MRELYLLKNFYFSAPVHIFLLDVEEDCFEERLQWMDTKLKGEHVEGSMMRRNEALSKTVEEVYEFRPSDKTPKRDIAKRMVLNTDEEFDVISGILDQFDRSYEMVSG